ncbi:TetR/AcrR family transcriptional regulator [Gordonia soli]|uniref:Putative TetR family transcriptional regulator n=1 Tax=Gordonia soli NBRC 108243 TaxID=1223545 RepID=M0QP20_9ACTN|nr:TetR/AcrR family transcriptional regulator [Gordonia soli]GAC70021.1 putative TetR family transcriptional regulator [Gordonia soli NBRC 108243]
MATDDGLSRAERRRRTEAEILEVGRAHLASYGAAAISLRAVARDLGMVSSAIYRYVDSRDELLTRLLVEGYDDLADEVTTAVEALGTVMSDDVHRRRAQEVARAVRQWAVANPERFALLYGSPVPGYQAPPERTVGPGTRVTTMLLADLDAAARSGALPARETPVSDVTTRDFDVLRDEICPALSDGQLAHAVLLWAGVIGLIGQEVFGAYGQDTFHDPAGLFDTQLGILLDSVFRA